MDRESLDTHMLEETVTSAAHGDRAARDLLLCRYWHIIEIATRARLKLVHGREDASDIAQDAAIRALLALRDYKWQGRKPFLVWLRTIADSAAADAGRRHTAGRRAARRELGVLDDETPAIARSAESLADVSRHADAVREQLERLDDDERLPRPRGAGRFPTTPGPRGHHAIFGCGGGAAPVHGL